MLRMDSHNKQAGTTGHMSHCPTMVPLELVRIHLHTCVSAAMRLATIMVNSQTQFNLVHEWL